MSNFIKGLFYLVFLVSTVHAASVPSVHRIALIKNHIVKNLVNWDGKSKFHWDHALYDTEIDVTGIKVYIGASCKKCDGTDFVNGFKLSTKKLLK